MASIQWNFTVEVSNTKCIESHMIIWITSHLQLTKHLKPVARLDIVITRRFAPDRLTWRVTLNVSSPCMGVRSCKHREEIPLDRLLFLEDSRWELWWLLPHHLNEGLLAHLVPPEVKWILTSSVLGLASPTSNFEGSGLYRPAEWSWNRRLVWPWPFVCLNAEPCEVIRNNNNSGKPMNS